MTEMCLTYNIPPVTKMLHDRTLPLLSVVENFIRKTYCMSGRGFQATATLCHNSIIETITPEADVSQLHASSSSVSSLSSPSGPLSSSTTDSSGSGIYVGLFSNTKHPSCLSVALFAHKDLYHNIHLPKSLK